MERYRRNPVVVIVLILAGLTFVIYADVPGKVENFVDEIRAMDPPPPTQNPSQIQQTVVAVQATQTALARPTNTPPPTATSVSPATPTFPPSPEPTATRRPSATPTSLPSSTPIPPPTDTMAPSPYPSCGPAEEFRPPLDTNGNRLIDASEGWVHADLSSDRLNYDEVSILLEPGTKITVTGVSVIAWRYDPECSRAYIEQQISAHQTRRREAGKTIVFATLNELQQAGIALQESSSDISARTVSPPLPTTVPISLSVSSRVESGTEYVCAISGNHRITIVGGAYNPFGNESGWWRTVIYVFTGNIVWDNNNEPFSPFSVGNYQVPGNTLESAQAAGLGRSVVVYCNAGETLRLVTVDTRGSYQDLNDGEVAVSVELVR